MTNYIVLNGIKWDGNNSGLPESLLVYVDDTTYTRLGSKDRHASDATWEMIVEKVSRNYDSAITEAKCSRCR